jgi:hypothetical protein
MVANITRATGIHSINSGCPPLRYVSYYPVYTIPCLPIGHLSWAAFGVFTAETITFTVFRVAKCWLLQMKITDVMEKSLDGQRQEGNASQASCIPSWSFGKRSKLKRRKEDVKKYTKY